MYGSVSVVRAIKRYENAVDEKESEIERLCLKLIIRQQPVASDLLFITSAMKMITDMERIADQAVDISELVVKMSGLKEGEIPEEMSAMADAVQKMVVGVMQAFTERSEQKSARDMPRGRRRRRMFYQNQNETDFRHAPERRRGRQRTRARSFDGGEISRTHRRPRGEYR